MYTTTTTSMAPSSSQVAEVEQIKEMIARTGFETGLAQSYGLATDRFPKTEEEAAKAELALAQALEKVSLHDREQGVFDLHGIDICDELVGDSDPAVVADKIRELNKHLALIPEKTAYDRAVQLNPAYVNSQAFQLMCLRKERFDAEKAAEFIVYHLEEKMKLFGDGEVLARDVRLTDLSKDDIDCLKSGFLQICPSRDCAGRTIVNYLAKENKYKDVHNACRAMWYIVMCAMKDEETQKKGSVLLCQNYGSRTLKFFDLKIMRNVQCALPKRICGAHYCFSNPVLWPAVQGIKLFTAAGNSMRLRTHFGEPNDLAFELQTFGIPEECCPQENLDLTWHLEWLHLQQMSEERESSVPAIIVPGRFDVLFGKGKKAREHPGTIRCLYLVELMQDRYEQASRQEKTIVADQIIAAIRESKGRFLKCEKGLWVEVDHSSGREKISHWFRHMRSKGASSKADGGASAVKRPPETGSMFANKRPSLVDYA